MIIRSARIGVRSFSTMSKRRAASKKGSASSATSANINKKQKTGEIPESKQTTNMGSFYDLGMVKDIDGKDVDLNSFKGKVSLVVNVASK
jgi:hypothetical protein